MDFLSNTSSTLGIVSTSDVLNVTRGRKSSEDLPSFVFSVVLTVIGIIGNSQVLLVYIERYRKQVKQHAAATNPYLVFVISLGVMDTFTCYIILPMINIDLSINHTPFSENMCKVRVFLTFMVHVSGVLHVALISVHCYRQLCKPLAAQIRRNLAIKFCILFDVAAALVAFPVTFLATHRTEIIDGEEGLICTLAIGRRKNSFLPKMYVGVLSFGLFTGILIICVCNITLVISRWRKPKQNHQKYGNELNKTLKTSAILITIALLFILSYVPYMILAILNVIIPHFQKGLSGEGRAAREFFLWFPFFNNVVNPFVYGLRDTDFRLRLAEMYLCNRKRKEKLEIRHNIQRENKFPLEFLK